MKTPTKILASAIFTSGLLAVSASYGQLTLNEYYEVRSDTNNGSLSQRWIREGGTYTGPSDIYSYYAAPPSGGGERHLYLRMDGSNPGSTNDTGLGRKLNTVILFFQLPELQSGLSVGNANLGFSILDPGSGGTGIGNVDLWGLGFISDAPSTYFTPSPAILSGTNQEQLDVILQDPAQQRINELGPLFFHTSDTDTRAGLGISQVVKIQDDIIHNESPATTGDRISTNAEGSANLDVYLNSLYAGDAEAGDWAVFRLTYDNELLTPNDGFIGYEIAGSLADPLVGTDPTLAFTAIPEPSTVAFFSGLAALAVVGLVRRRSRS